MANKEHVYQVNDQVFIRRPILHGRGSNLIKVGTILAFAEKGQKAIVSFPADSTRLTLKLSELEPVKAKYARDRVQINPVSRNIGSLMY